MGMGYYKKAASAELHPCLRADLRSEASEAVYFMATTSTPLQLLAKNWVKTWTDAPCCADPALASK